MYPQPGMETQRGRGTCSRVDEGMDRVELLCHDAEGVAVSTAGERERSTRGSCESGSNQDRSEAVCAERTRERGEGRDAAHRRSDASCRISDENPAASSPRVDGLLRWRLQERNGGMGVVGDGRRRRRRGCERDRGGEWMRAGGDRHRPSGTPRGNKTLEQYGRTMCGHRTAACTHTRRSPTDREQRGDPTRQRAGDGSYDGQNGSPRERRAHKASARTLGRAA